MAGLVWNPQENPGSGKDFFAWDSLRIPFVRNYLSQGATRLITTRFSWVQKQYIFLYTYIAARVLATYLIPGCVGRGVRLGSESSSGGAGGVWKSGGHFSGKKKAPAATYPQVQGFQKIKRLALSGFRILLPEP